MHSASARLFALVSMPLSHEARTDEDALRHAFRGRCCRRGETSSRDAHASTRSREHPRVGRSFNSRVKERWIAIQRESYRAIGYRSIQGLTKACARPKKAVLV